MDASLWSIWNTAQPALAGLKAGEWALLIMLGASLLVLSAVREPYLLIWTGAWGLLITSRLAAGHGAAMRIPLRYIPAVEQAAFVLAMALFSGAVFGFVRTRNLLTPLAAIAVSVAGFAVARTLLWPDSLALRVALEVSYRIILLAAAVALLRARRGRWGLSSWLLATSLLLQHLTWAPFTSQIPSDLVIAADMLLGVSMLLVVFEEAGARMRRLRVLRVLTESIVLAQHQ